MRTSAMATLSVVFGFVPFLFGGIPAAFLAVYLILRWRDLENPVRDPQLGAKSVLLFFRQLAVLVALSGATVILTYLFESWAGRHPNVDTLWTGLALVISNALVWFAAGRALARTNESAFPRATRMFLGFTAVLSGILAITALSAGTVALFTGESGSEATLSWAVTVIWLPATALLVGAVLQRSPVRAGEDFPRPEVGPGA